MSYFRLPVLLLWPKCYNTRRPPYQTLACPSSRYIHVLAPTACMKHSLELMPFGYKLVKDNLYRTIVTGMW